MYSPEHLSKAILRAAVTRPQKPLRCTVSGLSLIPALLPSLQTFNLRDLSKVVQGCMRCDPRSTSDIKQVS